MGELENNEMIWQKQVHMTIIGILVRVMVFNATLNNISAISWRSVVFVEETEVLGENHRTFTSHWQTLSHNVVSCTLHLSGIWTYNFSRDRNWLHLVINPNTMRSQQLVFDQHIKCCYDIASYTVSLLHHHYFIQTWLIILFISVQWQTCIHPRWFCGTS